MTPGVVTTPLPHLSGPCPKCGSESRALVWIPTAGERYTFEHLELAADDPREHMRVTCSACGFTWAAAPLDASGRAEEIGRAHV